MDITQAIASLEGEKAACEQLMLDLGPQIGELWSLVEQQQRASERINTLDGTIGELRRLLPPEPEQPGEPESEPGSGLVESPSTEEVA